MPLVTLIGEKLAIKDSEFIYIGPNNECRNCKLKTVCFNLKTGRKYKITNVRDKKHNCNIHEGTTIVIEVQEEPIIISTEEKIKEGAATKIKVTNCRSIGCPHFNICNKTINKEKKYKIKKIIEKIDCPLGHSLQKIEITEE
jgi:uncharacterized protein (UPF0179 family)